MFIKVRHIEWSLRVFYTSGVRVYNFLCRTRVSIKIGLERNEHFAEKLPLLKTEHDSTCKNMRARAPTKILLEIRAEGVNFAKTGKFEGPSTAEFLQLCQAF